MIVLPVDQSTSMTTHPAEDLQKIINIPDSTDKYGILSTTADTTDDLSPIHNKSVFSFYIQEVSNINPFHSAFKPTFVSTPRKSHHVSMPALRHKTKPVPYQKARSLGNIHPDVHFKVRPFSIKVQSCATVSDDVSFKKPRAGRRSTDEKKPKRTRTVRMKKKTVNWMKNCSSNIRRHLSCTYQHDVDLALVKRRKYYFL